MRISGHAYPWDVIGDPSFVDRVAEVDVDGVTLAAAYHSARAATPLHPVRQVVDARYAALYRPVRESVWAGRRLRPAEPDWVDGRDSYGEAAGILTDNGIPVTPWIVLTHATRLGQAFPDLAVTNCFGETYPYALCPAHAEVREYAATLAAEVLRDVPVHEVSLEACGQLGVNHLSHHDKTGGAWSPAAVRWLSVCCCSGCRSGWARHGLDPDTVVAALRDAVRGEAAETARPVPSDMAQTLLSVRHDATDRLRAETLAAVRQAAPGVPVVLHANPDPWATGASPGLTPTAAKDVDALLVPAWPTAPATTETVASAMASGVPVDAYVTVLPPADLDELPSHIGRLAEAGVRGLNLYHLGLAPRHGLRAYTEIRDAMRAAS
ncbi:hypothetical protein [Stackebrandtia nassauensis]|uniref:Alanine-rich protein n=1 Tax=Stackebrandtia nassauensis (strain DSM 44728 / CIP 108903 / NRRL B-16338 / NBRC 102104 / LLR-40K-21) TaxID=446470 RepID=D3Q7W0_STANL|nr:hypothetical protein [Stackebrandtia nassauensis]ADD40465.1 hypothetical protein Snas_0753 [Stackebrandtia nassauensis DSM 44728]